jgi:hypothetical protein
MSSGRPWRIEEEDQLELMISEGKTHSQIAIALDRPTSSIASCLEKLRVQRASTTKAGGAGERKERSCLNCQRPFQSAHCMNRLCGNCRRASPSPFDL